MNSTDKKPKTIKLSIIVSLTISIAIIILILFLTINAETLEYLSIHQIRYEFFFAAIGVNVIYWILWGVRLRILSNAIDKNVSISLWESTKIVIANLFLANITPSMAGGEPVRIHLLNKDGLSVGCATASVLGERLLDAIFLLCCVPFALLIFRRNIEIEALRIGITIAIGVFILAMIVFIYAIKNPDKTKSFLIFLGKKIDKLARKKKTDSSKIVEKINREVDNFHDSMVLFLGKGRKDFLKAGIATVIFWSTGFMIPSLILLSLGLEPFIIESYAAQVLLIIIIMMPTTPGSVGIAEGGVAALYSVLIRQSLVTSGHPLVGLVGLNEALIVLVGVFVILFRFITYHMNLIGGAILQYRIFKSVASFSMDMIKKEK